MNDESVSQSSTSQNFPVMTETKAKEILAMAPTHLIDKEYVVNAIFFNVDAELYEFFRSRRTLLVVDREEKVVGSVVYTMSSYDTSDNLGYVDLRMSGPEETRMTIRLPEGCTSGDIVLSMSLGMPTGEQLNLLEKQDRMVEFLLQHLENAGLNIFPKSLKPKEKKRRKKYGCRDDTLAKLDELGELRKEKWENVSKSGLSRKKAADRVGIDIKTWKRCDKEFYEHWYTEDYVPRVNL